MNTYDGTKLKEYSVDELKRYQGQLNALLTLLEKLTIKTTIVGSLTSKYIQIRIDIESELKRRVEQSAVS